MYTPLNLKLGLKGVRIIWACFRAVHFIMFRSLKYSASTIIVEQLVCERHARNNNNNNNNNNNIMSFFFYLCDLALYPTSRVGGHIYLVICFLSFFLFFVS